MPDEYLYRADWPHRWRRRSGLRRDRDVVKMPKEMLIWHKATLIRENEYTRRSNDRFGLNPNDRLGFKNIVRTRVKRLRGCAKFCD